MSDEVIKINTVVSTKDLKGYVQLRWGENGCQMTPQEARKHAYYVLEAAEAAESDSIMASYLNEVVGLKKEQLASILNDFRIFRQRGELGVKNGQHRGN